MNDLPQTHTNKRTFLTAVPTAAKHPHGLERMLGNWCGSFLLFNIFTYFIHTYVYTEEQINMNESQHIPSEYSETPPVGITGKWSLGKEEALFNFLWSCKISSLISEPCHECYFTTEMIFQQSAWNYGNEDMLVMKSPRFLLWLFLPLASVSSMITKHTMTIPLCNPVETL